MESRERPTIIIFPCDPPIDYEAITKSKIAMFKDALQNPDLEMLHENYKVVIELYETGKLSSAKRQTVYIQGGQVFENEPELKKGLPILVEHAGRFNRL